MKDIFKSAKNYKELGKTINRKEWKNNWRETVFWSDYFDYQVVDIEDEVSDYCEKNNLEFLFDCGWLYVISNRYHYNRILDICDEILGEFYEDDEDQD